MEANVYQLLAARTIADDLDPWEIELHALHGMVGEIGEIHSLYQKVYQGHGEEVDDGHLMKEVGDLCWFIAELASVKGWTLSEILSLNIEKLKRRYPDGFEADRSLHRAEGDV